MENLTITKEELDLLVLAKIMANQGIELKKVQQRSDLYQNLYNYKEKEIEQLKTEIEALKQPQQ